MAKLILRGNQESTLIWALELARASFDGIEEYEPCYKEIDRLLASFEKQLDSQSK